MLPFSIAREEGKDDQDRQHQLQATGWGARRAGRARGWSRQIHLESILRKGPGRNAGKEENVQRSRFKLGGDSTRFFSQTGKQLQTQRGDGVHHALAKARVDLAAAAFEVGRGEMKGLADDDGDRTKAQPATAPGQSLVRAENAHRHDGRERFRDDKPNAVLRRLKIAVERARALGKNERALVCAQNADERLESAAIAAFLIDRNDVQLRQQPAEHRDIEK